MAGQKEFQVKRKLVARSLLALTLLICAPAAAQQDKPGDEIVVVAMRSGAPMWEVTRGDATVLLVGEIAEVPKATPWRPAGLELAARRAQNVILQPKPTFSVGIIFKVMFNAGKITRLPKGKVADDYLSADQQRRLAALEQQFGKSYDRGSFLMTARDLLNDRLKYGRDAKRSDVTDIVRGEARRSNIPTRPVGRVSVDEIINDLFKEPPETHVPCLDAAMRAVEAGPDIILARGLAWTRFDIPAVMHSPLEIALGSCFPWTDVRFGPQIRQQWGDEVDLALGQKGVTLAVVPLRILAEKGGLLDRLRARGEDVSGPPWQFEP